MMKVRMTEIMVKALTETPEIPDNLLTCLRGAETDGDMLLVDLGQDERMALTEVCEWYVRSDPDTGNLTEQGKLFESIIQAIIAADLAE
ncbi:MAG: hypothetical protein IIB35_14820 [Gemmatimonadetes bacterium]|nr:hypothetical protein [Gemmatimonadota bacterium]